MARAQPPEDIRPELMQRAIVGSTRVAAKAASKGAVTAARRTRSLSQWLYDKLFGRGRELPLQADGMAVALAALLGVMVYLAAIGLAATVILGQFASGWEAGRSGEFTVEVRPLSLPSVAQDAAPATTGGTPSLSARVGAALSTLRATPGVQRATPLGDAEMKDLLTPWLGPDLNLSELPLPVLITVQLDPNAPAGTLEGIADKLPRAIPGVRVDDHNAWLAELRHFVGMLGALSWAVIFLLAGAGALTVVLVTRITLLAHRDTVEILHVIGATDRHIAWQFQTFIARIAAVGSGTGASLALVTLLVAKGYAGALSTPLLPDAGLHWWFFLLLLALTLPTVGLATMVARVAALWWVRRLP